MNFTYLNSEFSTFPLLCTNGENLFSATAVSTCQKSISLHNNSMHFETLVTHGMLSTGHIHLAFSCFSCSQTRGMIVPLTVLPGPEFYPLLPLCNPDTETAQTCRIDTIHLWKTSLPKDDEVFFLFYLKHNFVVNYFGMRNRAGFFLIHD